jgi:hypothetical protein
MGRRLLRRGIHLAAVLPVLVAAGFLVGLVMPAPAEGEGSPLASVLTLALWAAGMLGLWVLLGRCLPGEG